MRRTRDLGIVAWRMAAHESDRLLRRVAVVFRCRPSPPAAIRQRHFGHAKTPSDSSCRDLSLPRSRFARSPSDLHENGFEGSTSPPPIYFSHRWIIVVLRHVGPLPSVEILTVGIRRWVLRSPDTSFERGLIYKGMPVVLKLATLIVLLKAWAVVSGGCGRGSSDDGGGKVDLETTTAPEARRRRFKKWWWPSCPSLLIVVQRQWRKDKKKRTILSGYVELVLLTPFSSLRLTFFSSFLKGIERTDRSATLLLHER
ncbi:hypothetical protein V6N12_007410 [Hibiscus sabdariffa]|uniref:Uncharacterized protein n=1 Tax=Hibiscus sabdariffa TaxID=183260 RepID=A0ABR2F1S6_9ROSI